jgi:hypothetical protein
VRLENRDENRDKNDLENRNRNSSEFTYSLLPFFIRYSLLFIKSLDKIYNVNKEFIRSSSDFVDFALLKMEN